MDPYERLAAINESMISRGIRKLFGRKPKKETKKETPSQMFSRMVAGIENRSPDEVAAKLDVETRQRDKKIFGESTEKIDQEFGAAKKALKDAGIKFKALQAIGSLDREKNTFNIPREDMRKARQVLKNFPNAQNKRA